MCSGSVSLQDIYNIYMLGPIEVTPDNQDNSIRFVITSSRENLNRFYDASSTVLDQLHLISAILVSCFPQVLAIVQS